MSMSWLFNFVSFRCQTFGEIFVICTAGADFDSFLENPCQCCMTPFAYATP